MSEVSEHQFRKPYLVLKISPSLIQKLRAWLGYDGCAWFLMHKESAGTVSPILRVNGLPHAVHFREGMQVRNFMRSTGECDGWSDKDYDDNWVRVVELAIYA